MLSIRNGILLVVVGILLMLGATALVVTAAASVPSALFIGIFLAGKMSFLAGVVELVYLFAAGPGKKNVPIWLWLPIIVGLPVVVLGGAVFLNWWNGEL